MTAKEKLEEVKKLWNDNLKNERTYEGPDGRKLFEIKYGVRCQRRCCFFCRFGVPDFDGECSCLHPERIIKDANGNIDDIWLNTYGTNVCNAFEERTDGNGDIDYGAKDNAG